ncbi:hypothetical protein FNV43_RR20974 [Rhamnella rubrinervis]|uniref:Uncharacterized protein n=1 Tax=Rhamnella rubrinervis TaxID=2594499 RepID=A0A8K0E1D1_9ROSA|nr:hypothetical protein FNV43_RR20974 [Rhamnella rubrinervis]
MRIPQPRDSLWENSTIAGIFGIPAAAATVDGRPIGGRAAAVSHGCPHTPQFPCHGTGVVGGVWAAMGPRGGGVPRQATHPPLKSLINRWPCDSRKHHIARGDIRAFFEEIHGILMRFFACMLRIMYSSLLCGAKCVWLGQVDTCVLWHTWHHGVPRHMCNQVHGKLVLIVGNALICQKWYLGALLCGAKCVWHGQVGTHGHAVALVGTVGPWHMFNQVHGKLILIVGNALICQN